jgi:hypothetical protein
MRPKPRSLLLILLTSTALTTSALVTGASAQHPRFGGGGGGGVAAVPHGGGGFAAVPHGGFAAAPHVAAPAPHFAAPSAPRASFAAPHVTAPHVTAPHFAATPHFAAPSHYAAPHIAPHNFSAARNAARLAAPNRFAAHHISAPRPSVAAARHIAPGAASRLARHNLAPRGPSELARHNPAPHNLAPRLSRNVPATSAARRVTTPAAGAMANQATANRARELTLNTPQMKHLQMHYTGGSPILRNTTLASRSSHDPAARALSQSTFRGNFAQSNWGHDWGWRHHHHHPVVGFVLGFVGPVFWPYAYADCIDYIFWPYAYDTFWPYAFDDVFEGIYGAYAPEYYAPEDTYAYAGGQASSAAYAAATEISRYPSATGVSPPSAALPGGSQICSGQAQGLTDFPIERIAQQVSPDQHQRSLLDDLKAATARAVSILQAACPNELPSTPTGRVAAMRHRVEAMLQAVQVVRPALDAFYSALSDEQKERFNALDEDINAAGHEIDVGGLCARAAGRGTGLPVGRLEHSLQLSARQDRALKDLDAASAQAADILKGSCQPGRTLTPTGRLAAMEDRLNSMLQAINTVEPALVRFYDSLDDEQKARFDRLNIRPA